VSINTDKIAEKVFNILRGNGFRPIAFDKNGKKVIDPLEASWFSVDDPNIVVKIDYKLEELSFSSNKDESLDQVRQDLKNLSQKYLYNFDFKTFDGKLSPKSEEIFVAQNQEKDMADVMEAFGTMTGSSKTSYQPLDNVKIIVKHKAPVNEESRGARSRNIHSIYIQRGEERFKMAENNLHAARAMARHLQKGGETFDNIGNAITEMAADLGKLRTFTRYVQSNNLVNEDNQEYVTIAFENIENIKNTFKKLSGVKTYANAIEHLEDMSNVEMLEDDVDLEAKFTETHFDSRVSDAMDSIKRSMNKRNSFESTIRTAIKNESFANLRDMLQETDMFDFASHGARLGYQVSQLGHAAENSVLKNHLYGISKKLNSGDRLGQFEYDTIKSCLLSAKEARVQEGNMYESAQQDWENFIEKYNIL
jgi:hypothetical protein